MNTEVHLPEPQLIDIGTVDVMSRKNPNVMSPERYEQLKRGIVKHGFLQPILVYPDDEGQLILVDGVHRTKAMTELGASQISAVIASDEQHAVELRMLLNRVRGELDQSTVAADLLYLSEFEAPDELTTGYTLAEVTSLLDIANYADDDDDLLAGAPLQVDEEIAPKVYGMALKFESESQRALVKEWLREHGDSPEKALIKCATEGQ